VWDRDIPPKLRDRTKTGPRARYSRNLLAHIHLSEFADRAECEYNMTSPLSRLAHFPPSGRHPRTKLRTLVDWLMDSTTLDIG
jgi:hypothetical protein